MTSYDVVIAGGGPAGTAAALTLLTWTKLQVLVVERSDYSEPRVGETVSPGLVPLLKYLGLWEDFMAAGHLPAYGSAAAWGSREVMTRDFLFTGRGDGWHLDRRRFDEMLAQAVVARGGELRRETSITDVEGRPGAWQLGLIGADGGRSTVTARVVIDASGRQAGLARRLGAERRTFDRLVGVVGFYEFEPGAPGEQLTLVESAPEGWWYSAVLPEGRRVIAFMSDADRVQQLRAQQPEGWAALLGETEHTRERVAGGRLCAPLYVRAAHSQVLAPAAAEGWVAAGDAAASFDPLSSMGIGHAVSSGIHAARVAQDLLEPGGALAAEFSASVESFFARYLQQRQGYYRLERRWADHTFWARRQEPLRLADLHGLSAEAR